MNRVGTPVGTRTRTARFRRPRPLHADGSSDVARDRTEPATGVEPVRSEYETETRPLATRALARDCARDSLGTRLSKIREVAFSMGRDARIRTWIGRVQSAPCCRFHHVSVGPAGIEPAPLGVRTRHAANKHFRPIFLLDPSMGAALPADYAESEIAMGAAVPTDLRRVRN